MIQDITCWQGPWKSVPISLAFRRLEKVMVLTQCARNSRITMQIVERSKGLEKWVC